MALRNVVIEGDEILRKHCREVTEITDRIRQTMEDSLECDFWVLRDVCI